MVTENIYKNAWYAHGAGVRFAQAEQQELSDLLPELYGYHLVQLGNSRLSTYTKSSLISHRVIVDPDLDETHQHDKAYDKVKADLHNLPFRSDSVDVAVLLHTLEQATHPHEVLREVERVLISEGYVVITGINPISLWGLWLSWKKLFGKISGRGHLISLRRLRDWLKLLNFQVTGGRLFYYRPPIFNYRILRKLEFLERWGKRCWPFLGGGYTLVAVKRRVPMTPLKAKWKTKKEKWIDAESLPKPTAQFVCKEKINER